MGAEVRANWACRRARPRDSGGLVTAQATFAEEEDLCVRTREGGPARQELRREDFHVYLTDRRGPEGSRSQNS